MVKKMLVNRVYWAPEYSNAFTLGASGSQVTIQPDGAVHQHNDLMAPGDPIMFWHSSENYQMAKTVPQLPFLQPGGEYRIVVNGRSFPERTVLYRVGFTDNQGHHLKDRYFRDNQFTFTMPEQAANWEIVIVNAGATDFYFTDFELAAKSVPEAAFGDFWIQGPVGEPTQPKLILLIPAGRRFKTNFPDLGNYCQGFNGLPIVVSNHVTGEQLTKYLKRIMQEPALQNAGIVSCGPALDDRVIEFAQTDMNLRVMILTNQHYENLPFNVTQFMGQRLLSVIKANALEPDWPLIFNAIRQNWGEQHG